MKKILLTLFIGLLFTQASFSQRGKTKYTNVEEITSDDFKVQSPKTLKKTTKLIIPRTSIHFKTITNETVISGSGTNSTNVSAWAVLQGVSEETRQEITNTFYDYLIQEVEKLNIEVLDYSDFKNAEIYSTFQEKQIDKTFSNKNTGENAICTYQDGPHTKQMVGNPGIWNAAKKLAKQTGANTMFVDVTLDFARFDIKVKTDTFKEYNKYFGSIKYDEITKTTKAKSIAIPQLTLLNSNGATGFNAAFTNAMITDTKGLATTITSKENIAGQGIYAESMDAYGKKLPENMKKNFSIGKSMTTGTFVIQANEAAYKEAALKLLKAYADELVSAMKAERA